MNTHLFQRRAAACVAMPLLVLACGTPRHVQAAEITIRSGSGAPVEGASVFVNGDRKGATRADGSLGVAVTGLAGERFRVEVECPNGYRAPVPSEQHVLVTPGLGGARPEFVFECRSRVRKAVVRVRAERGADLPIRHLGRELGRTDASGQATVTLDVPVGEAFELLLDTSDARPLHPQNPVASFEMPDEAAGVPNDAFVFDQKFTVETPKLRASRAFVPRRLEKSEP